jgi:adenylosuccinate lyase
MDRFDAASPLDARYYLADPDFFERLRPFVSESSQIGYMAKVEAALAETLAEIGVCAPQIAAEIAKACDEVEAAEVYEEEDRIQHNIRALANCIRRRISPEARPYVHLFATSQDITDTARAMSLRDVANEVLIPDLKVLTRTLIEMARLHAETPQMGRTHGRHAVPITFGFSVSLYVSRIGQRIEKIADAAASLRGKFAGAVGAYNTLSLLDSVDPKKFEDMVMERLGLPTPEISSQIVQPEYVADFIYALDTCWGVMANIADDFRHLFRSEIGEITESAEFDPNSEIVGSSTMPHKVNPKDLENIKSLWKAYMPRLITVLMDQISEHQRDLTNSASGRFVTEFAAAFAYGIRRLQSVLLSVAPNVEKMSEVLQGGKDAVVAEPLYLLLSLAGHPDAHEASRKLSQQSRIEGRPMAELIRDDPEIGRQLKDLSPSNRKILEDPAAYLGTSRERTIAVCDAWESRLSTISVDRP